LEIRECIQYWEEKKGDIEARWAKERVENAIVATEDAAKMLEKIVKLKGEKLSYKEKREQLKIERNKASLEEREARRRTLIDAKTRGMPLVELLQERKDEMRETRMMREEDGKEDGDWVLVCKQSDVDYEDENENENENEKSKPKHSKNCSECEGCLRADCGACSSCLRCNQSYRCKMRVCDRRKKKQILKVKGAANPVKVKVTIGGAFCSKILSPKEPLETAPHLIADWTDELVGAKVLKTYEDEEFGTREGTVVRKLSNGLYLCNFGDEGDDDESLLRVFTKKEVWFLMNDYSICVLGEEPLERDIEILNHVQCEAENCGKWRILPWFAEPSGKFCCILNKWNPALASCFAVEEPYVEEDAVVVTIQAVRCVSLSTGEVSIFDSPEIASSATGISADVIADLRRRGGGSDESNKFFFDVEHFVPQKLLATSSSSGLQRADGTSSEKKRPPKRKTKEFDIPRGDPPSGSVAPGVWKSAPGFPAGWEYAVTLYRKTADTYRTDKIWRIKSNDFPSRWRQYKSLVEAEKALDGEVVNRDVFMNDVRNEVAELTKGMESAKKREEEEERKKLVANKKIKISECD
jgi:hypothetical protein